jgi:hypothetical protein
LFGCHLYVGSRARLTEDRRPHSSRRDDFRSIWVPTVLGMMLQRPGWRHSDGDGRTGPKVTEGTRFASLTSRHRPGRVRGRWSYPFRGFRHPLSRGRRGGGTGEGGTVSWADTDLTAQLPHSIGDGRTARLMEQRRGMIPRQCQRAGVAGIHL